MKRKAKRETVKDEQKESDGLRDLNTISAEVKFDIEMPGEDTEN